METAFPYALPGSGPPGAHLFHEAGAALVIHRVLPFAGLLEVAADDQGVGALEVGFQIAEVDARADQHGQFDGGFDGFDFLQAGRLAGGAAGQDQVVAVKKGGRFGGVDGRFGIGAAVGGRRVGSRSFGFGLAGAGCPAGVEYPCATGPHITAPDGGAGTARYSGPGFCSIASFTSSAPRYCSATAPSNAPPRSPRPSG